MHLVLILPNTQHLIDEEGWVQTVLPSSGTTYTVLCVHSVRVAIAVDLLNRYGTTQRLY